MSYGKPESSLQRFGEEIARLRTARSWSRVKLIHRLIASCPDDKMVDTFSEAWLGRLESGQVIKVPRSVVEALCNALHASSQERARLLLMADRNIFYDEGGGYERLAEVLNYVAFETHREASNLLSELGEGVDQLSDEDLEAIASAAFEAVLKWRLKERNKPSNQ